MKFTRLEKILLEPCSLIYRQNEYSFDIEPHLEGGGNPLSVNEIQLEIDVDDRLLYVWGYCPLIIYEEINHVPTSIVTSSLKAEIDEEIDFPYKINPSRWSLSLNKKEGWICIGDHTTDNTQMIEFSHGCVAALRNDELIALWLHPKMV